VEQKPTAIEVLSDISLKGAAGSALETEFVETLRSRGLAFHLIKDFGQSCVVLFDINRRDYNGGDPFKGNRGTQYIGRIKLEIYELVDSYSHFCADYAF